MKKNILLLLMSCLFLTAAHARGEEFSYQTPCCVYQRNIYGKFLSGANFLQNNITDGNISRFKTGYIIDLMLGYCLPCGLRLEAEYALRRNGIKKIDFFVEGCSRSGYFQNSSIMANLLWDLPLSSCGWLFRNIEPFIGLGLGGDFQQMHASNSRIIFCQKWRSLSWQAMLGLSWPIFCNTDMTFEYKFHQGGYHFYNHSIGIGLMYKFGY